MSVGLYLDVHIPYAVTIGLRLRSVDLITAQEDQTTTLDDSDLLDRATALGRILFSQDKDLLREAHRRQRRGQPFGGIIYAPQGKVSVGQCVDDLEVVTQCSESAEWANRLEYLPLR